MGVSFLYSTKSFIYLMKLGKLSLIIAVIGVVFIYFVINVIGDRTMQISEATGKIGSSVKVMGTINSVYKHDGNSFMRIGDPSGDIKVVVFERSKVSQDSLERGKEIVVKGKVKEYNNEIEIIASEIVA